MGKYDNIKKQKLILKHDEGAIFHFIDENHENHDDYLYKDAHVDLDQLVASCFEPLDEKDDGILVCSCGDAGCAGFYHFSSDVTNDEIIWDVNNGDDLFKFDKDQYISEIKNTLEKIKKLFEKDEELEYFSALGFTLNKKDIEMLLSPFDDNSKYKGRPLQRHKIIIAPGDGFVYLDEKGRKIFFKDKSDSISFSDTDFWGYETVYYEGPKGFRDWYQKSKMKKNNWEEWNKQGIEFAKQLRKELPKAFDIWYKYQGIEEYKDELVHITGR